MYNVQLKNGKVRQSGIKFFFKFEKKVLEKRMYSINFPSSEPLDLEVLDPHGSLLLDPDPHGSLLLNPDPLEISVLDPDTSGASSRCADSSDPELWIGLVVSE